MKANALDAIDFNNINVFKTWNYKYFHEDVRMVIVDALSVLCGDYGIYNKQAALLLLKALIRKDFLKFLLDNKDIYPFDRNDYRVAKWKKTILSKGKCESCGCEEKLEAHHIIRWADYPQGRIDVNNGMCLCHECHTKEHYGENSYYMMKAKCS
jgi:hypothetical protein